MLVQWAVDRHYCYASFGAASSIRARTRPNKMTAIPASATMNLRASIIVIAFAIVLACSCSRTETQEHAVTNPFSDADSNSDPPVMAVETFWNIVESSSAGQGGDQQSQTESLANALRELTPKEIEAFRNRFSYFHAQANDWDLWGIIYIAHGGCSDDMFIDFRNWLISRGRDVYERAMDDPESLASVEGLSDGMSESYGYVADTVYKEKTGKVIPVPPRLPAEVARLKGTEWSEEEAELRKRFPKTWGRYGWD